MKTKSVFKPAINIQFPWSQLILTGGKTIETRTYPIPKKYIGIDLLIIETPGSDKGFKARIVGIIRFGGSFRYNSVLSFQSDYSRHLVDQKHIFFWKPNRKYWGWEITYSKKFRQSIEAPKKKGIRWTSRVLVKNSLVNSNS